MKINKNKKGFTLTELIIVIVIIGILAAVLIPSLSSYIKKAKTSKDIQNAKNMNNILIDYFDAQIPDNLEAADIRYVVQKNTSKYDFIPSAAKDGYSYWYNKETKRVVFGKAKDLEVSNGKNTSGQKNVANTTKKTSIEEIVDGYLLLDVSGTALSETLHSLRSISGKGEFTEIYNLFNNANSELMTSLKGFTDAQKAAMAEHINQFNPNQTLYINDFSSFTTSSGIVKYVVFDNNILNIPSGASQSITKIDGVLRIPDSVEFIEPGAFTTIKEVEAIEINDARKIRISKTDTEDGNASFSAELIEKLGDKANQFLEMRSIAIAEAETKLAYEKEKVTEDGLTYLPYNLSINPNVKIFDRTTLEGLGSYSNEQIEKIIALAESDGYELGSSVFITKWRVKYDKNTNGTTTMNVKMFDDKGLIAAKTVVYREIYDINMSLDGANLTYDNVARLMYRDESDANDAAKNYTYTIKIGDMKFAEIKATEIGGTKGMKVLGDVEKELTNLEQAQSRIQELYEKVKKASYVYTSEPTINKLENGLWTLSYTYTVNSKNDAVGKLQSATKTDTSNGNENTIADVYSIVEDVNATSGSDKYRIVKVSTQKGLIYSSKNVYYYLHNDKSNLDNYDGLLNSYVGKNLFVTNVYEKITASSLDSYKNQIDNDGNLNITITLQDNTNTEIISKTQKFKLNDISRVFSEEITDGQTQILDYLFNNIPAYFNQNSNVIDLYPEIFKRNFTYDYENQNILYDLNEEASKGYINLFNKLKGLYSEKTDEEIKKILEKAYFIKNTAPISKLGNSSTTYDPSKSDPYFLVIDLDTTTIGHKTMKLIGIFDELKIMDDGTSSVSSTSRIIQFNYRVGNSDELEITRINGRYLYGTGKNQEDPFYIYPFDLNSSDSSEKNINLGIRGLTQVKLIDNSTLNLDYSTIQSVKSDVTLDSKNNYQTVFEAIPGTDKLYKLTIKYYVGAINYYNEQTIYCKLIDKQQVEISTINNRDASLNDNFLFYQGENIGLTSNPFSLSIGNNIAQTNILSLTYTYSTGTIYQTILTVTKENNEEDKYYFIRGDKLPDELDLRTLSEFGLKITGDRSKCEINKDLSSDYYYCKGYYFSFKNQKGETKIYYPYATNSPDLTNKYEAYKNVCPNPLQYFIIIKRADGTYGFDMIDTYLKVGKNTSGLAAYTAEVKNDINYWIDMNLKAGDKGTLKFDTYVYNYFAVKPSDVDNNIWKYKYNGSQFDNWILIDRYYSEKKYEVLSDELLNSNIQNLVINSQTYTWYGGDTTTIGKILFDADEIIQKRNRTYIQIPLPSKTGVQTIYASNNKNNYYIEMFLNGNLIDYNDPNVFASEKFGELKVKVTWYGLVKEYKFSYEVVDYMELAVDRVLNEKYYGQVVEVQNDKKLITNSYDGNTIFNLYDKFMPLASIRDIRISDDGVKVSIVGQGVNTTLVNDSTDSKQYKTLKELGCKDDEEYEITVLYANKEAKFKIKVVAKEEFEKAKFYYVNGRYISTNYGTSINPFYFVTGEKIKLPYGYEKGAFTNVYQNGYLDGSVGWLSATIYSPSSKTIDLCGILGNYDEKTKEFKDVKFSVIKNNTKTPITFEQNSYAQIRYKDGNYNENEIIHTYYYTVSENVLSGSGVLAVEFNYEGRKYKAELQFEVVDYYFTSINNRDQTYVAPNTTSNNIKTANQKVVFDHDENISLGSHLLSNGHIGQSNRWYVTFLYQIQNSNLSFVLGGYTSDYQLNGKKYSGSEQLNGSTIYYDKTTSNLLSTYAGLYSYDFNQKASPFSAAYVRLYDDQNNLLTSQEGKLLWKCDVKNQESLEINNFKFSEYATATYGEIIFIERDEKTQFKIEFIMRDDINKNDSENAHFVRVNNLYLNNYGRYGADYIPEFDISEGNPIYLSGATQIRLPDFRGKGVSNQYAPDIVYHPGRGQSFSYDGKFENSGLYSGYIVQYYLSQVSASELINSDYEYTVKDISDTNIDRGELILNSSSKWKMVKRVVDSNSLDIWSAWPKDENDKYIDEVILYLIYRYNDGKLYNLKLKLKVEKDMNTTVGVRRLNGVYYYPELGVEETEFIIDANNTVISLSNSLLYYSYSPIYTNSIAFSKNAEYQYKLDGSTETKKLTVKDNMIKLPSDEFIEGATGTIIIQNMAITGIPLKPIEFKFRVAKYEGEIYKLNNMTSANGNFKVYKNEKISTSGASVFKNVENEITKTRGFNAFTQDVTITPYFLYYFEISETDVKTKTSDETIISYDDEGNEITTIVQTTTKYYVYGNYECEVIQEGDKYFYQIPDTETWKFEKNGILRVSYKPNPSAPLAYIGYANITIVEKTANENLSYLYYDLINGDGKSVSGLQPLYTAYVNAENGHTKETPIIILKNLFINSDYTNKIVVPKTTNSAFRYYRADGTLETVYCNNQNVSARVYDVNANGELVNGREYVLGESSLYNGEEFNNETLVEGYGIVYSTNVKALVLYYELYGITYSVTTYYCFSTK